MKHKILFFYILASILLSSQCGKLCFDNKIIHIEQKNYNGTELKIDGYYKIEYPDNAYLYFIYYRNGVFLTNAIFLLGGGEVNATYSEVYDYFNNVEIEKSRFNYGLFDIKGDSLFFEGFKNTLNGQCYPAYFVRAVILNDTTFVAVKEEVSKNPKSYTILSDTFHFYKAPKPDSTNAFFP